MKVIFFGSTTDSVIVLSRLFQLKIVSVVTQPPRPVGRNQQLIPTPVEMWTKAHNIPVLSFPSSPSHPSLFSDEQTVIDSLQPFKPDLLISASFGQKIPWETIQAARFGGLNVHPSLLPRWRGADPVPWAIMAGDAQTGVTIVTLSQNFDAGTIIAQKKIPITEKDFADPLRTRLFALGADLLTKILPDYSADNHNKASSQPKSSKTYKNERSLHFVGFDQSYARRLTRDDGFIPWELITKAMAGQDVPNAQRPALLSFGIYHLAFSITRLWRALTPWPGLWTMIATQARPATQVHSKTEDKRLKILACHTSHVTCHLILDTVQLEGKKPVPFAQFKNAYLR